MRLALVGLVGLVFSLEACGAPPRSALPPAGSAGDDATGLLARASTGHFDDPTLRRRARRGYGGSGYGGWLYGGAPYGDDGRPADGIFAPVPIVQARLDYAPVEVPRPGAIEGVVRWPHPPAAATTLRIAGCGEIANPTLRRRASGEVEGALVYLAKVGRGRAFAGSAAGRTLGVGGLIERRGCALWPPVQVLAPAPATLLLSNAEAAPATLVGAGARGFRATLGPGDRRTAPGGLGASEIGDEAGRLAPAWVIGLSHPYFALTDAEGRFRIDGVPPGSYQLMVWQAPLALAVQDGRVVRSAPVEVQRAVTVAAGASLRLAVDLPAR